MIAARASNDKNLRDDKNDTELAHGVRQLKKKREASF